MPELTHLPADAPTDEIMAVLHRDGALILDGVIAPDDVDALADEQPLCRGDQAWSGRLPGFRTTRNRRARRPLSALPASGDKCAHSRDL